MCGATAFAPRSCGRLIKHTFITNPVMFGYAGSDDRSSNIIDNESRDEVGSSAIATSDN